MLRTYFLLPVIGVVMFLTFCAFIDVQLTDSAYKRSNSVKKQTIIKHWKPKTSLVFLKTHKCASSTIQNIIMRFGLKRGLFFALPYSGNYLGNPVLFHRDLINKFATPSNNEKLDILAHHTRYNSRTIRSVMKQEAVFVTILRDPAYLFESLVTFYESSFKVYNISLESLTLTRNVTFMQRLKRTRFGINQMLFDLGLDEMYFSVDKYVNNYIKKLDAEFDLVMISEYMEASVVLFADLMRWRLEDVVYLSLNSRNQTKRHLITLSQHEALHKINHADSLLYNYFLQRLHTRIIQYGTERLLTDVNRLIYLNNNLKQDCVASINSNGYAKTISYTLRNKKWLCIYATKNELHFTNEIRYNQIQRLKILNNIRKFMYKNHTWGPSHNILLNI